MTRLEVVEQSGQPTPTTQPGFESVVTQRISFRAGHVVLNPHVHDFIVVVTASGAVTTSGDHEGMGVDILRLRAALTDRIAGVLGHRMSVWLQEDPVVRARPCDWPKDIAGPVMPDLVWSVRPTLENLGRWAAAELLEAIESDSSEVVLERVEVAETPRSSVIFDAVALEGLRGVYVPGPICPDRVA